MVDLSKYNKHDLGKLFDFSVLPKNSNIDDIKNGCREAVKYNCAAFYPATNFWLPVVTEELAGSDVLPASTISFPFGGMTAKMKGIETEESIKMGAKAIDLVMNIGALRSKMYKVVEEELKVFINAAQGALTKCILEVCFLTDEEIVTACKLLADAGFDYAKTSSGQFEGPTMEQFLIMKNTIAGTGMKLKVAGVKFPRPQNAYAFIMAGADLIGTRAAPQIIDAIDQMREIGIVPKFVG